MTPLPIAEEQAARLIESLRPFMKRIEVAGSVRRKKPIVKDIELIAIPYPAKLLDLQHALRWAEGWRIKKGHVGGKYIQFERTPYSDQLDLFFATERNFGCQFAIRTGSADFSHKVLAAGWVKQGYKGVNGTLFNSDNQAVFIPEEIDLFRLIRIPFVPPEKRG
jgi:DNA polymerase/3'-5' exonuclease PolX